ncbi:hypothetical protein CYMTET_24788 [Cymbomonas tetramitiformis]|uniref:Uncharacterized protein n=1 Tax=Cymbomonas tetramitiformis TaxID=36881 RepID=A0AAE0KZP9_9CHLO|nr:hypothetical protein CYMTET_24788 [Cymbomonas tetramitiformis]
MSAALRLIGYNLPGADHSAWLLLGKQVDSAVVRMDVGRALEASTAGKAMPPPAVAPGIAERGLLGPLQSSNGYLPLDDAAQNAHEDTTELPLQIRLLC